MFLICTKSWKIVKATKKWFFADIQKDGFIKWLIKNEKKTLAVQTKEK